MNLNDMFAQNQAALNAMARQYGLSQQQTQAAIEALMPAFSQGLKQNAADPYGVGAFVSALASGQHARYFEDASRAFTPEGMADGNGILGHLFGSKDLSRAVAAQAAQATGIGQQVLQQMLPAIAAMIMGGLFKQSTNQFPGAQFQGNPYQAGSMPGGSNPLGEIIEQMMRQGMGGGMGGAQPQQRAPQPANPFDNPFGKVLQDMFGGGAAQQPQGRAAPQNPMGDNPFGRIFEEMMGSAQNRSREPEPAPKPRAQPRAEPQQPRTNPSGRPRNPYDDLFGEMFETGRKSRDEYQKGVESIFEQFTKGMDRYR